MNIKQGVSFWSYLNLYQAGMMSIEDMFSHAKSLGAEGIELLPFMHRICPYPNYSQQDVDSFKELCAKYEVEPVCNASMIICVQDGEKNMFSAFPAAHKNISHEGMVELMKQEIDLTHAFGFKRMRHPLYTGMSMKAIEEVLPYAEDCGVALDLELHAPMQIDGPEVEAQIEMIEKSSTRSSGIIPDLNAFQDRLPECYRRMQLEDDADEDMISEIDAALLAHEDMKAFAEKVSGSIKDSATKEYLRQASSLMPNKLEQLRPIMKYVHHCHGKFFDIDENGNETTFDYPAYMRLLSECGFEGYFVCEYEGFMFRDPSDSNTKEQVERYFKMMNSILKNLGE